jgi:hypothetical protein
MLVHRFRELFNASEPMPAAITAGHSAAAFVPCPVAFAMTPMQQAQADFLYRLAFEQAQAQVAQTRVSRWPAFSLN